MQQLPEDFAATLARVLDPRQRESAAEIIEEATLLDDVALRRFLQMFAARVRASDAPIKAGQLRVFLERAARGQGAL